MLPTTILQWALNSVVCNFTCEFLVGTMGTTYLHLTWQSTIYKALSISTSAPGIHVITLATLKPMAIHGLCSMTLAHHAKCAAFAKFHPTNRSDSRVYLENIHGLKWHEAELQIDSGVSAVWSQNDNCQQQGEGFFQKKWWAYQLYQLVHRKLQLHLRVLAALSLLLGLWVQWLLRPTLLKWQHIDTLPGGKARRKKLSLGGFELLSLLVKEFPLDLWIKQTNDCANDNSVVNSHHHTDMPRHIDLNLSNDLDRTVAQGVI